MLNFLQNTAKTTSARALITLNFELCSFVVFDHSLLLPRLLSTSPSLFLGMLFLSIVCVSVCRL